MENNTVTPTFEERIFQLVAEKSDEPRELFDRDTALAEHLDSLDRVELVMAIEDEFELSIPDEDAEQIVTVGQLIDAVQLKLSALSAAGKAPDARHAPPRP